MGENFKLTYNVDMVFCIDATGSMGGLIEKIKANALNFDSDVRERMKEKGKEISNLRVRIIAFRDYVADKKEAMLVTNFFDLPMDNVEYEKCIRSIDAKGGGDEPEDGLEALAYAIKNTKWYDGNGLKKQVIVVWTDASTHELGYGRWVDNYPKNMAKDFNELTQWWGDAQNDGYMDYHSKRLVLFAPNKNYWSNIADNWGNVIFFPSKAGDGIGDYEYREIIDLIVNSI